MQEQKWLRTAAVALAVVFVVAVVVFVVFCAAGIGILEPGCLNTHSFRPLVCWELPESTNKRRPSYPQKIKT